MGSVFFYEYPVGAVGIAESEGNICRVFFKGSGNPAADFCECETEPIESAAAQLREYFHGTRTSFELPLAPHGTEFQRAVWNALLTIPFGETRTYSEIAELTGNTGAARAVGNANNKNPLAIIVPCHRVVGADGSLTGYAGGLHVKEYLLNLERQVLKKKNVCK